MMFENFNPTYVTLSRQDAVTIATFRQARLSDEINIEEFGHELISLIEQFGCDKIVLNLHNLEYASSSVLGKLITLHRRMHRDGGKLCLCGLTDPLTIIFRTSHLIDYFEITENVDEAIRKIA